MVSEKIHIESIIERSVVAICVDGRVRGTGFVIADDTVLTCAHVISGTAASLPESMNVDVRGKDGEEREATIIDWRPASALDLAVLNCQLPKSSYSPVHLRTPADFSDLKCQTFGFPKVADLKGLHADVVVNGRTQNERGHEILQLDSKQLAPGHSGAPLIEVQSGRVLGMANAIVRSDLEHLAGKMRDTAFGIPVSEILTVLPDLVVETPELDEKHSEAIERLKEGAARALGPSKLAMKLLAEKLREHCGDEKPCNARDEDMAHAVAEAVLASPLNLVLDVVLQVFHQLSGDAEKAEARKAVVRFGGHIFPAVYNESQLRAIRASIDANTPFLVLPSSGDTILEVLMAGVDGRPASFSPEFTPNQFPGGASQLQNPPEAGLIENEFEKAFENALYEALSIPLNYRGLEQIEDALLSNLSDKHRRFYYIFTKAPRDDVDQHRELVIRGLKERYKHIVFIKRAAPTDKRSEFRLLYRIQDMFKASPGHGRL